MPEQKPTIGRIVHYHLAEGETKTHLVGKARPALVVSVREQDSDSSANLKIELDGEADNIAPGLVVGTSMWKGCVPFDADGKPGTWCWPPRV